MNSSQKSSRATHSTREKIHNWRPYTQHLPLKPKYQIPSKATTGFPKSANIRFGQTPRHFLQAKTIVALPATTRAACHNLATLLFVKKFSQKPRTVFTKRIHGLTKATNDFPQKPETSFTKAENAFSQNDFRDKTDTCASWAPAKGFVKKSFWAL